VTPYSVGAGSARDDHDASSKVRAKRPPCPTADRHADVVPPSPLGAGVLELLHAVNETRTASPCKRRIVVVMSPPCGTLSSLRAAPNVVAFSRIDESS
jgi:hypothetical protein